MFQKPYKVKSNTPLKGSDSKRLRQRIENAFPKATCDDLLALLPAKGNVTLLKLVTANGFHSSVYCVDKLPLFFERDCEGESLTPTIYALWKVPSLVAYFTTHPAVVPKLSNGADLMLPGVVAQGTGMNIYGRHRKGDVVGINLSSNKSAVGVGILPRGSDDLYMCGGQGVAVKVLHLFGDKLWNHEPGLIQQIPNQKPTVPSSEDFPELGAEVKKAKSESEKEKEEGPKTLAEIVSSAEKVTVAGETSKELDMAALTIANNTEESTSDVGTKEMEEVEETPELLLKNAFLAALKNHGKSLQLPLLTSNFYRLYVVPESVSTIDLKKTKYKKFSNFLNEMVDQGFLVVREETKGVDKIISVDLEHPEVVNFVTDYKQASSSADGGEGHAQPLFHSELTELYLVTDGTVAFFTKMGYKRGEGIPAGQIKKIIREYINKNNLPLVDTATKSFRLDETLRQICECPDATLNRICSIVTLKMEHSYQMCSIKDVSSSKPMIQMSLATRSGNKKVTLVSNIECYGIILTEFIKLCKQGAAASTTIVKLPNQKREQLQIQGNQVRFVYNLLTETYKVPPKCILGLELAKDGKKHKKK